MKYRLIILFFSLLIIGCKTQENVPVKENPPTVFTKAASDVSLFSATLNGEVTDEGFTAATDRGFVYSEKNTNPSVSDSKVQSGYGKGVYLVKVDKLALNTKYYFKAYSTNTKGTSYGEVQNFTTTDYKIPTVTTDSPLDISYYSVNVGGSVTDAGGLTITQRGICYGLIPNPTTSDNKVISGEGLGAFKIGLQNLKDNSKYYVRAYAINSKGTGYGNEQTFNTLSAPVIPQGSVLSKTGRIWMARDLGDGYLYQWGRGADGHQLRNSPLTSILSSTDQPKNGGRFITNTDSFGDFDWRKPQNNNLWQGVNGINNPCPVGYRLPTAAEWEQEIATWSSKDQLGASNSSLKLNFFGYRDAYGQLEGAAFGGFQGIYWSSTIQGTNAIAVGFERNPFQGGGPPLQIFSANRVNGYCVRCIKD